MNRPILSDDGVDSAHKILRDKRAVRAVFPRQSGNVPFGDGQGPDFTSNNLSGHSNIIAKHFDASAIDMAAGLGGVPNELSPESKL